MTEKLIECVPNFSEARDMTVIKQITDVIESVDDVKLLDVDPGPDMNRTVVTFVGSPEGVKEAAFLAIGKAYELIDMSKHQGSHPRMGATDVCPFVPVSGVTEEECIKLSKEVAERVGREYKIPIYLYEKSASTPDRENLAKVRAGEYEALPEKLKDEYWKPDFGPAEFNERAGATAIGVREFLIAYNISLNTREKKYASDIAFELREKGRSVRKPAGDPFYFKGGDLLRYAEGNYPAGLDDFVGTTIDETAAYVQEKYGFDLKALLKANNINPEKPEGKPVKKPGTFDFCKAIGWMVGEYDRAQISINLTNYKVTSMHHVFEETLKLAAERGLIVTGSEIVGLVPFNALLESGKYFLRKQGRSTGIPVMDILNTAVQSLGLADVSPFDIKERVLGLPNYDNDPLVSMTVTDLTDEVSRESPAPGGGSIAALAGSLGAALSSMVSNLTANKRGTEEIDEILNNASDKCQYLKDQLMKAVDADTNAFNAYMDARRLPQNTTEEKEAREKAMQDGLKLAVNIPYRTAVLSYEAIEVAETVVQFGNINSITDVGVGANMAFVGVTGGIYNVLINLKDITDQAFNDDMREKCAQLKQKSIEMLSIVSTKVEKVLDK